MKLNPCPFCGESSAFLPEPPPDLPHVNPSVGAVMCASCGARGPANTSPGISWNEATATIRAELAERDAANLHTDLDRRLGTSSHRPL